MDDSTNNTKNNKDYKHTLNLPQTEFPMKASLATREPDWLNYWKSNNIYQKSLAKNAKGPKFVLHDGPPYANGPIHFGHMLNKTLKDIIIKIKNMSGYQSEYVPGWDCHGLPIEHQVDKNFKAKKQEVDVMTMRKACRSYAQDFVDSQREQFKRLGIFGDWDHPYVTMDKGYEATIARKLAELAEKGMVYKGSKPIHWCTSCMTALAEAEVEYDEHESPSVYVKFSILDDVNKISPKLSEAPASVVIWTTTPWTLPANLAVAIHKGYMYVAVKVDEEIFILAEGLLDAFRKSINRKEDKLIDRISASKLHGINLQHPFLDRQVKVVYSNHVTLDAGTGCVHIAPGHGQEDYEVGVENNLPILNPVDDRGVFSSDVGLASISGQFVFKANPIVIEELKSRGKLIKEEKIKHSYPHCWRCKSPVIFRSTPQYFISMEKGDLRNKAMDAIRKANWIPAWGRERIYGMVESRSDWCISRQRSWGNPLMTFSCNGCKQSLIDSKVMHHIADLFLEHGSDIWFEKTAAELLPAGTKCAQCGKNDFEKERDILDVWFDSGVSYAAVLQQRDNLAFPADMYLEGSDQHRGWFHSSLLTSVGSLGVAPYKNVLTHGFVVDGDGKKYSKSAKNYQAPELVLNKVGADILRLWVASEDYRHDIRFSGEIVERIVESYRKYRNTVRYLLGNLFDFDAKLHYVQNQDRSMLDKWAMHQLQNFIELTRKAYDDYEFHTVYHAINNFCVNTLSSFYLDILKDRLYVSPKNSELRRAAQSTLYDITEALVTLTAPILSFTSEEIYQLFPKLDKKESVFLEDLPKDNEQLRNSDIEGTFDKLIDLRAEVLKALELARKEKIIGHSLEAQVRISAQEDWLKFLRKYENELTGFFIVSQVVLSYDVFDASYESQVFTDLKIKISVAEGEKCVRCWIRSTTVGKNETHPELCSRCVKAVA